MSVHLWSGVLVVASGLPSPPGRFEIALNEVAPQGERTRDRILTTAARLFSQNGYDHTPLSHVAREAGVSKALILWHFDSKEDLFRAALGRTLEPYRIDADAIAGLDAARQIERLVDLYVAFVSDNGYSVRFIVDLMVRHSAPDEVRRQVHDLYDMFRELLTGAIARGRDSGAFRLDTKPDLEAALVVTTLAGILMERFLEDTSQKASTEELLRHLKETTLKRLTI